MTPVDEEQTAEEAFAALTAEADKEVKEAYEKASLEVEREQAVADVEDRSKELFDEAQVQAALEEKLQEEAQAEEDARIAVETAAEIAALAEQVAADAQASIDAHEAAVARMKAEAEPAGAFPGPARVLDSASGIVIVDKPIQAPGCCAVTLTSEDYDGFIDTGLSPSFVDPHIYVSVSWVKQVARHLGFTDDIEIDPLLQEIKDLQDQLERAEKAVAAINTLESSGFVSRKKRGPKPTADDAAKAAARKPRE